MLQSVPIGGVLSKEDPFTDIQGAGSTYVHCALDDIYILQSEYYSQGKLD